MTDRVWWKIWQVGGTSTPKYTYISNIRIFQIYVYFNRNIGVFQIYVYFKYTLHAWVYSNEGWIYVIWFPWRLISRVMQYGIWIMWFGEQCETIRGMVHDSAKPIRSVTRYETRFGRGYRRFPYPHPISPFLSLGGWVTLEIWVHCEVRGHFFSREQQCYVHVPPCCTRHLAPVLSQMIAKYVLLILRKDQEHPFCILEAILPPATIPSRYLSNCSSTFPDSNRYNPIVVVSCCCLHRTKSDDCLWLEELTSRSCSRMDAVWRRRPHLSALSNWGLAPPDSMDDAQSHFGLET